MVGEIMWGQIPFLLHSHLFSGLWEGERQSEGSTLGLVTAVVVHRGIHHYFRLAFLGLLSERTASVHKIRANLAKEFSGLPWMTLENSSQLEDFQTKLFGGVLMLLQVRFLCAKDDDVLHTEQRRCRTLILLGSKKWKLKQIYYPIAMLDGCNAGWRSSESSW